MQSPQKYLLDTYYVSDIVQKYSNEQNRQNYLFSCSSGGARKVVRQRTVGGTKNYSE